MHSHRFVKIKFGWNYLKRSGGSLRVWANTGGHEVWIWWTTLCLTGLVPFHGWVNSGQPKRIEEKELEKKRGLRVRPYAFWCVRSMTVRRLVLESVIVLWRMSMRRPWCWRKNWLFDIHNSENPTIRPTNIKIESERMLTVSMDWVPLVMNDDVDHTCWEGLH